MTKTCSIHNISEVRGICIDCGSDEHLIYDRDYCSCFPDFLGEVYIGECCKIHDNMVGQAGTYNPTTPHIKFYECLSLKVSLLWAVAISTGGFIFTIYKYPYLAYKKYRYRRVTSK